MDNNLKPMPVEASYEDIFPVNWEHIGTVLIDDDQDMPEFIRINGIKYKKEGV